MKNKTIPPDHILEIKARHILLSAYIDTKNCPICRAAKEYFNVKFVQTCPRTLTLLETGDHYRFKRPYLEKDFDEDFDKSDESNKENIIRRIELFKVESINNQWHKK